MYNANLPVNHNPAGFNCGTVFEHQKPGTSSHSIIAMNICAIKESGVSLAL
jgi:hypothetical protein